MCLICGSLFSNEAVKPSRLKDHLTKHVSGELHDTLDFIVKCINRIKDKSLNDRLFRLLCQDNDEDFERLLLHTEVRRLSKGACLTRFYLLYNTVMEFFEEILKDKETTEKLIILKNDVAYLSDIFFMLNESNKQLQGNNMTKVKCNNVITSVITKLERKNLNKIFVLGFCPF